VKITLIGKFNDLNTIRAIISNSGGTIHSIDEVVAGRMEVREEETLHERMHE